MTESEFCDIFKITPEEFRGDKRLEGYLSISNKIEIDEENSYNGMESEYYTIDPFEIPKGFNPNVDQLKITGEVSIPEGFSPCVKFDLYLKNINGIPKGFNPVVGNNLYLDGLAEIPEGFNPYVGGQLYLRSLKEIPENFNPKNINGDVIINSDINWHGHVVTQIHMINIKPQLEFLNFHK